MMSLSQVRNKVTYLLIRTTVVGAQRGVALGGVATDGFLEATPLPVYQMAAWGKSPLTGGGAGNIMVGGDIAVTTKTRSERFQD